ncbi:MAG: hypothetical protein JXA81_05020 [Sedimentisphaerales bacterium]|nr:hypothetical protein [Sedimentisphaerales bacterium]
MSTKKKMMVAGLMGLAALWLVTGGKIIANDEDTPVERPFMIHSDITATVDWSQMGVDEEGRPFVPWTSKASQLCIEGWSINIGSGVLYLDTFDSEGSGLCTYTTGDTIEWDSFEQFGTQHTTVTFTGGTGRFENITGGFSFDYTILNQEVNEEGNPVSLTSSYWGEGTITY